MKQGILLLLSIFLLQIAFLGQKTFAQEVLGQSVSTNEFLAYKMDFATAIRYSLEHNDNIRAMKKGLSATERDIGIERSKILPKFRFNENFVSTNNPTDALSYRLNQARATPNDLTIETLNHPDSVTNFLTAGVLEQKFLDKKSMIEIKMAKKAYSANGYTYLREQENLVNQVAHAYLRVSSDEELIKVTKQSIKETKEHLDVAETRLKNKIGLEADVLRARSALREKEEKLNTYQKNLNVDKRHLGLLLGLESFIEISNTIPEMQLKDLNYYKSFSVYRNDIKATEIRVQNAKNNIDAAHADWYPTLTGLGSYSFYNSNYPFGGQGNNYTVGAFFKWEPLDGNKRKYEILKAKDKEAEAKEYLEGLKKEVDFRVYESYSNVEDHQKNLELAIMAQKEAEEDVKHVEKQWENSELPHVALVDAQINLDKARENVVNTKFDLKEDLITLDNESGIIYEELALK